MGGRFSNIPTTPSPIVGGKLRETTYIIMRDFFLIVFSSLTILSCKAQSDLNKFEKDEDGITVEKFDPTIVDENRYNVDNVIYKVGRKFTFNYYYQDPLGFKYLMTKDSTNKKNTYDWYFEKVEKNNPNSIYQIILTVKSGLSPIIQHVPNYNETIISYDFKLLNGEFWINNELTGVVENVKNLWIHPPRTDFFKILEINPFPYIKEPVQIGNAWTWNLKFGSHWADKRWLTWEGQNENHYNYNITDKTILKSKLGDIECFVVSSDATSKIGKTKLTSYYSKEFGFVKLDYTNVDGSKTIIELEKME